MVKDFTILKNLNRLYDKSSVNKFQILNSGTNANSQGNLNKYTYRIKMSLNGTDSTQASLNGKNVWVVGWCEDETFTESISNKWDKLMDAAGGALSEAHKILSLFGGSLMTTFMHRKVWTDIDPIEFDIKMKFISEGDAFSQVVVPARMLQLMCLPSTGTLSMHGTASNPSGADGSLEQIMNGVMNGVVTGLGDLASMFLSPPGGAQMDLTSSFITRSGISARFSELQVGNFASFKNFVPENVSIDWDMKHIDKDGYPLSATATVKLTSYEVWTNKTILNLMGSILSTGDGITINPSSGISNRFDSDQSSYSFNIVEHVKSLADSIGGSITNLTKKK